MRGACWAACAAVVVGCSAVVVFAHAGTAVGDPSLDVRGTYVGTATGVVDGSFVLQITEQDASGDFYGIQSTSQTLPEPVSGTVSGTTLSMSGSDSDTATATISSDGTLSGTENLGGQGSLSFTAKVLTGEQANDAVAQVDGLWQVDVTALSYKTAGTPPPPIVPTGDAGPGIVRFASTCSEHGICTVAVTTSTGADQFVLSNGLTGIDKQSMTRIGSDLSYSSGGYGLGSCTTPPPPFAYSLSFEIVGSTAAGSGWRATKLTGSETVVVPGCQSGAGQEQYKLTATPVAAGVAVSSSLANAPKTPPRSFDHITAGPAPIARALPTPAAAFSPLAVVLSGATTIAFLLFITFPATLFNKTFEENYDTIQQWWLPLRTRVLRLLPRKQRAEGEAEDRRTQRVTFLLVVLVGALLGALLNPSFGANSASAEGLVATLLAEAVGALVGAGVGVAYRRARGHGVAWHVNALPAGLLVAAFCVVVSRLSDFQPGYLYGIVYGVVFVGALAEHENGHLVALSHLASLGVSVAAWFAWVPVNHMATHPGANVAVVVLDDVLASVFAGGLVGTLISLIPMRFMPGHTLVRWHKGAWAAVFGVSTFGVVDILVRPSSSTHAGRAPLVTVIALFVVFGGGSLLFRWYFERRERREAAERSEPAEAAEAAEPAETPLPTQRVATAPGLPPAALPSPAERVQPAREAVRNEQAPEQAPPAGA